MQTATSWSTVKHSGEAIHSACQQLKEKLLFEPHLLLLYASVNYDSATLLAEVRKQFPNTRISGCSSCLGVMTEEGFHHDNGFGMGLMAFVSAENDFGVNAIPMQGHPEKAAMLAVEGAINDAGRAGETPDFVLLNGAPGYEERVLESLQKYLGSQTPIQGGSSADNKVEGNWQQFANHEVFHNAIVVTVFYFSKSIAYAFHSGYEPTNIQGVVTKSEKRNLIEIDNKPAAEVYNQWTKGCIEHTIGVGGNVLALTTLYPLGRIVGTMGGIPYYRLSHPDEVLDNGTMRLFSDMNEGDLITLMSGTKESLLSRAGRVAQSAMDSANLTQDALSGAFVVYCAGCMLTVQDDMDQVVATINRTVGKTPFIGIFTFGEQGCFVGGENCHGNLMISSTIWEK